MLKLFEIENICLGKLLGPKVLKDVLYFKLMRNERGIYLTERVKFRLVYMSCVEFEETNNY